MSDDLPLTGLTVGVGRSGHVLVAIIGIDGAAKIGISVETARAAAGALEMCADAIVSAHRRAMESPASAEASDE